MEQEKHEQHRYFEAQAAKAVEGWIAEYGIDLEITDPSGNKKPASNLLRELKFRLAAELERMYVGGAVLSVEIADFNRSCEKAEREKVEHLREMKRKADAANACPGSQVVS